MQGVAELPPEDKMEAKVAQQHEFNRRNFTQVKRHALMVILLPECHALKLQCIELDSLHAGKEPPGDCILSAETDCLACWWVDR